MRAADGGQRVAFGAHAMPGVILRRRRLSLRGGMPAVASPRLDRRNSWRNLLFPSVRLHLSAGPRAVSSFDSLLRNSSISRLRLGAAVLCFLAIISAGTRIVRARDTQGALVLAALNVREGPGTEH